MLTLYSLPLSAQWSHPRPKIGLTLSGGGAKGLAHIGILKAIDSAGLKIDYITGTSMGAIIGGLYAIGYSAAQIEDIASTTDWDLMLSNQSPYRGIVMEEKDEYGRYALELPWVSHDFRLPTGVFEGEELWLRFSELFYPVYARKKFSQFSIPFKCIGTDVSSGEAVVLDSGEITSALRSSMAIPSFFTSVQFNGRKLIDGGIVRNFPVRDVKDMGADIVIGSNVAAGLRPPEKVTNVLQILLQVAFFREAQDHKEEVRLCDIYVNSPLEKYTMGSFNQADEIINAGLEEGRKLYPRFKRLADSLNAISGEQPIAENRLPPDVPVKISSYEVNGLVHTDAEFFVHTMDLLTNHYYTAGQLSRMVRKTFGTRYYNRITYSLIPEADGSSKIVFDVTENPLTFAKLGLHYNKFSGMAVIANFTRRNFLTPASRSLVTLNIGENFRARAEHLQYIGRLKKFSFALGTHFEHFDINTYNNYKTDGVYGQYYGKFDGRFQYSTNRNLALGLGSRIEWIGYRPSIPSSVELRGNDKLATSYFFISHNSLDRKFYPKRGWKIDAEADWVFGQSPNLEYYVKGTLIPDPTRYGMRYDHYQRVLGSLESYLTLFHRTTLIAGGQAGINFNYHQGIVNEFSVGGLTSLFHNQVLFAGLPENSIFTPAVATFQFGLRYQILGSTYIIGRANALLTNFINRSMLYNNPDIMTGYALTFAYNFALGPLEFSAMYCDQSRKIRTYVNIGIPF